MARLPLLPLPCSCPRCSSPSEPGSHLSSLLCPACLSTLLPNSPPLPNSPWTCTSCSFSLTSKQVETIISSLVSLVEGYEEVEEGREEVCRRIEEDLLPRLLLSLHPSHYLVLRCHSGVF